VEILLKKAKVDPVFRGLMERDAVAAAASIGLDLSATERSVLDHTPPAVLHGMIDRTFVPRQYVRIFLSHSATAMLAVVLATTVTIRSARAGGTSDGVDPTVAEFSDDQLRIVQEALEAYKTDHGTYPSTTEWHLGPHPLESYVDPSVLTDGYGYRMLYIGVSENGSTLGYRLSAYDGTVQCPIDPDKHRYPEVRPIAILRPPDNPDQVALEFDDFGGAAPYRLEAAHRREDAEISWYHGDTLLTVTRGEHALTPLFTEGDHNITLIDDEGFVRQISLYVRRR
jgi:hypothetical protein